MIYSNVNNYTSISTPCRLHYIGGNRYMYDTEHTFSTCTIPDAVFDDVTGELYRIIEHVNDTIVTVVEL